MNISANPELGLRGNLSNLTKIPECEFEEHFQNWMQRDDVARSLQAKLRKDLIMNFNKTSLGKKLLGFNTMTTTGGLGAGVQRLTLSPLVLALNTLVAEFLYAQNCHFSLSVFCSEVPFCNTLPDFESMRSFRFSQTEVAAILEAVFPTTANSDKMMANHIIKDYMKNSDTSLLLSMLKALVNRLTTLPLPPTAPAVKIKTPVDTKTKEHKATQHESNVESKGLHQDEQFRQLNRYLLMLTKKVGAMIELLDGPKNVKKTSSIGSLRPRVLLSGHARKYEHLNRSLERATENLKQISQAKRKNRNIGAIVEAINTLSNQFSKCSTKLEGNASESKQSSQKSAKPPPVVKSPPPPPQQRSYSEWVHDMRHTENGQKFLDRIESSVRKTFNKQKEQLHTDMEMKLRLHKELLKVHYKQKLSEELAKHGSRDRSEALRYTECLAAQLESFEQKHLQTLDHKNVGIEIHFKQPPRQKSPVKMEKIVEERESDEDQEKGSNEVNMANVAIQTPLQTHSPGPIFMHAIETQKEIEKFAKNMITQERKVDHLVNDAKLRLQQLELESNQIDENFRNFLERQRLQKELTRESAIKLWNSYSREQDEMRKKYGLSVKEKTPEQLPPANNKIVCSSSDSTQSDSSKSADEYKEEPPMEVKAEAIAGDQPKEVEPEFKNAILEAKNKFFSDAAQERKTREHLQKLVEGIPANGAEGDGSYNSVVGAFFINTNFGALESKQNLLENDNQRASSPISFASASTSPSSTKSSGRRSLSKPLTPLNVFRTVSVTESMTATAQATDTKGSIATTLYKNNNYSESVADMHNVPRPNSDKNGSTPNLHNVEKAKQHQQIASEPFVGTDKSNDNAASKRTTPTASKVDIMKTASKISTPISSVVEDSLNKMFRLFRQAEIWNSAHEFEPKSQSVEQMPQPNDETKLKPKATDGLNQSVPAIQKDSMDSDENSTSPEATTNRWLNGKLPQANTHILNIELETLLSRTSVTAPFQPTTTNDLLQHYYMPLPKSDMPCVEKEKQPEFKALPSHLLNKHTERHSVLLSDKSDGNRIEVPTGGNGSPVRKSILQPFFAKEVHLEAGQPTNGAPEGRRAENVESDTKYSAFRKGFLLLPSVDDHKSEVASSSFANNHKRYDEGSPGRLDLGELTASIRGAFSTIAASIASSRTSTASSVDMPMSTGERSESGSDFWE